MNVLKRLPEVLHHGIQNCLICGMNDIGLVAGYLRDKNLCLDYMETRMQNIKDLCADVIISYIKI